MHNKIIEVTGPTGTGKSTFIKYEFSNSKIYGGPFSNNSGNYIQRLGASVVKLSLLTKSGLKKGQISWLFRQAIIYDETIYSRINALRNALLKFTISCPAKVGKIVIDEGVSHIPFIFQLNKKSLQQFVQLFRSYLLKKKIIFIAPPSERELFSRLKKRGHKRATSNEKLKQIININLRTYKNYKMILDRENIPFCVKRNKEAC